MFYCIFYCYNFIFNTPLLQLPLCFLFCSFSKCLGCRLSLLILAISTFKCKYFIFLSILKYPKNPYNSSNHFLTLFLYLCVCFCHLFCLILNSLFPLFIIYFFLLDLFSGHAFSVYSPRNYPIYFNLHI